MGRRIEFDKDSEKLTIDMTKINELIDLDNIEQSVLKRLIPKNYPVIGFGFTFAGSLSLGALIMREGFEDLVFYVDAKIVAHQKKMEKLNRKETN